MKKYFLAIALVVSLYSCTTESWHDEKIYGNNDVQEKTITVDNFNQIVSSGAFEIVLVQDTSWTIELKAESNILPLIDVYTEGSKLIVENKDKYNFELNEPIRITIHHSGVSSVEFNGSGSLDFGKFVSNTISTRLSGSGFIVGNITSSQVDFILSGSGSVAVYVNCDDLEASVSGTGMFNFQGIATQGVYSISGTGNVEARNLESKKVWYTVSGIGDATFKVSDELHVTVSGTGNVYYLGNPELFPQISGSGKLVKL